MFLKKLTLLAVGAFAFATAHASGGEGLPQANISLDDTASLQRGAQLYFNYCSGCHSLRYLRYGRIAEDLELDPKDVEKNFIFGAAKIGDPVLGSMPFEDSTRWFGKAPPDLSLTARSKGPDWILAYLKSFYLDSSRPLGWNNTLFPNASMPNVLSKLQGLQTAKLVDKVVDEHHPKREDGTPNLVCPHGTHEHESRCMSGFELSTPGLETPEQFDRTARDITAFLQYAAEPAAVKRESIGIWVLLYLALFTFLAWLLNKEYWKDVH